MKIVVVVVVVVLFSFFFRSIAVVVIETQGKSLAVLLKNETILSASVCIISTTMSNYNSPTFPLSVYLSVYIYIAIDFYSYWRWDLLEVLAL